MHQSTNPMKSRILTGPADVTAIAPRWPGTNIPTAQPLPQGATVATTVQTQTNKFSPEVAAAFLVTADKALKQTGLNSILPEGIDFAAAATAILSGAATGTVIPGLGTIAGAIIGLAIYIGGWLRNRRSGSGTYPTGTIHTWATAYAEQAFVDWAVDNGYNTWATVEAAAQSQLLFWLERWRTVIVLNNGRFYSNIADSIYISQAGGEAKVAELYKQAGVDYFATKEARAQAGALNYNIVVQYVLKTSLPSPQPGAGDDDNTGGNVAAVVGLAAVAAGVAYLASKS